MTLGFSAVYSVTLTGLYPPNCSLYSLFFYKQLAYHEAKSAPPLFRQDDLRANEADFPRPHRGDLVPVLGRDPARGDRLALADLPGFERRELEPLEGKGDLRQGHGVGRLE